MKPRGLEGRRRVDRTIRARRHVDTNHAGEGALANVDLRIAEKTGEQRQRFGSTLLAQPSQGLSSNMRRRTADILCKLRQSWEPGRLILCVERGPSELIQGKRDDRRRHMAAGKQMCLHQNRTFAKTLIGSDQRLPVSLTPWRFGSAKSGSAVGLPWNRRPSSTPSASRSETS